MDATTDSIPRLSIVVGIGSPGVPNESHSRRESRRRSSRNDSAIRRSRSPWTSTPTSSPGCRLRPRRRSASSCSSSPTTTMPTRSDSPAKSGAGDATSCSREEASRHDREEMEEDREEIRSSTAVENRNSRPVRPAVAVLHDGGGGQATRPACRVAKSMPGSGAKGCTPSRHPPATPRVTAAPTFVACSMRANVQVPSDSEERIFTYRTQQRRLAGGLAPTLRCRHRNAALSAEEPPRAVGFIW